ncbi:hypothetical protein GCM10010393_11700 [Streptomyces gobitricini]|uniref:Uncharacterized protein n=1 Tax=Streptomyces gobitricini TaxID=68211 RepID=A0ABN3LEB8_9ACTN
MTGAAGGLAVGGGARFAAGDTERVLRGTLPTGSPDYVYLPVEVPRGLRGIRVSYAYACTRGDPVPCPVCGTPTRRVHGFHGRTVATTRTRSPSSATPSTTGANSAENTTPPRD